MSFLKVIKGALFRNDSQPEPKYLRKDNLSNDFLGYGTARDKLGYGMFVTGARLTDNELHAMYYSDDIAAKIVNIKPAEMMRRGYKLRSKTNQAGADALQTKGKALKLDERMLRGMQWGRWQGGSLAVFGAIDGSPSLMLPLNKGAILDTKFINVVDKRYVSVYAYQENPNLPDYGEPAIYAVGSANSGGAYTLVHRSRTIRFDGVDETDAATRRALGGWTYSSLQRPYDVIRKFATSYDSVAHLMADASQGVWKIQGLIDLIASNREELLTRLQFSDMTRSAGRAVMVDAEGEDFERVATSFAGVKDVIEVFLMRLAAAADMPVTLLMGRSAAGMNATGDSDFRAFYGTLETEQTNELKPRLLEAYSIIGGSNTPADLDVEFTPLWAPSDAEKATTYKTNADADALYLDRGVVMPQQVTIARFGSGNGKIQIDEERMAADLENEGKLVGLGEDGSLPMLGTGGGTATEGAEPEGLNGSKVVLAPTDAASVVTVNEARKAMGLEKLTTKEGGLDEDGYLTVTEFRAKREAQVAAENAPAVDPNAPPPFGGGKPPALPGKSEEEAPKLPTNEDEPARK